MDTNDREAAGFRGRVAVCDAEQLEKRIATRESFRWDGKWTERWHRNPDGSEWSMVRRHDAEGRALEERRSGPPPQTLTYRYDEKGRLARVDVRSSDGAERVHESYLYHDDQTSAVTLYIDPPLRDKKNVAVSEDHMLHMSIDAVCIMTVRDSKSRPIKKVLYDADNRVIRRVLFRYDGDGRLLEEGEVESATSYAPICETCIDTMEAVAASKRNCTGVQLEDSERRCHTMMWAT